MFFHPLMKLRLPFPYKVINFNVYLLGKAKSETKNDEQNYDTISLHLTNPVK